MPSVFSFVKEVITKALLPRLFTSVDIGQEYLAFQTFSGAPQDTGQLLTKR
jgi:hypothetical protein